MEVRRGLSMKVMSMERRLLAVYGSPRKGGNTDTLLDRFTEGAKEAGCSVDREYLRDLDFSPCTECGGCHRTGRCVIRDELDPLFDKLLEYERVVFSFPVFFLGPPAITKAFIDRGQFLWVRKYVLNTDPNTPGVERKAFLLSVGGFAGSDKIFRCNISILRSFLVVCGLRYAGEVVFNGIEYRDNVAKSVELCSIARKSGASFIE
jgi:multimeric flavodoxin WrbA